MAGTKGCSGGKRVGAGRVAFKPTLEQQEMVGQLAGFGLRHEDIALLIKNKQGKPISSDTLAKCFKQALSEGRLQAIVNVANTLYQKVLMGDKTCMIFYLRTQAGWKDQVQHLEPTAQHGTPNTAACALIRAKVVQNLPYNEQGAICAHYGHLLTKANGVEIIAQAARAFTKIKSTDALLALIWGILGTKQEKAGLSLRGIAQYYGLSKSGAQRERDLICRFHAALLKQGTDHIAQALEIAGLIPAM